MWEKTRLIASKRSKCKCTYTIGHWNSYFIYVQCLPRKGFGSADCGIVYTIYLSLCTQSADLNPFRVTHCSKVLYISGRECYDLQLTTGFCLHFSTSILLFKGVGRRRRAVGWWSTRRGWQTAATTPAAPPTQSEGWSPFMCLMVREAEKKFFS